ncbi:uncharacterized protein FFB20_10394 [Fusarium fujikuroi]|uniref:Uncharacterized protein n=1 Tax=Fusarium fujikuroi TaxID=5127 RepID=A0A0I9Y2V3_FUSFU|nr:uncharacterized protein LW93_5651 [Fusarium fujikuroi]KLO93653.1 uncharacterized protein Y057_12222 [Fusarium fujikuroi]QGI67730.1 hypothetical protein CEK27_011701 [Fusarium fujikuroi]QGI84962.1 hypothetical protein CEK25_011691 [Fusarium fujikuroi]QGI98615.1 hypothetical protein CEK26_011684 [Fusarium fujikuroi]
MDTPYLHQWLTDTSTDIIALGHFHYEGSVVDTSEPWREIFESLISHEAPDSLVVISPNVEHRRDTIDRGFEKSGQSVTSFRMFSYAAWTDYVIQRWSATTGPTLKGYSMVIIDLDPSMTIECAMALLVTTHFVMDTAEDSMTRLFTVSCTDVDHAFERLADHLELTQPMSFHIEDTSDTKSEDEQTIYCKSLSELSERFRERIEGCEGNHIVLVYNSEAAAYALLDESWKSIAYERLILVRNAERDVFRGDEERILVSLLDGSRPRLPLSGYRHIHMVVQPMVQRTSFDLSVGQTTRFCQLLSVEERIELRSVFRRLEDRPLSATLYVIGEEEKEDEWWETGPVIRRKDVWNRNLGAFMTLVASLEGRVDTAAAAECFVPEGWMGIYVTMEYRLKAHGILKWNTDERLILGLEVRELAVFRAVLPFVGYDYRLAYFIAQGSQTGSDALLETKIQLAAVVNSGGVAMFDFHVVLPDSIDTMQDLIDACIGYSKPLSNQGSIWLALGLWKRLADHTDNFENAAPDGRIQFPGKLSLTADRLGCIKAQNSLFQMSSALKECGIHTTQKQGGDEAMLSESDCHDIQSHLFRAYLSQLASCCRDISSGGSIDFLDISSKRKVLGLTDLGDDMIDLGNIPNDAPAFGVYHGLRRYNNGGLEFQDFTFIPSRLVNDWVWEFRDRVGDPTYGIENMLRVECGLRRNYDGLRDEVWNPKDQ